MDDPSYPLNKSHHVGTPRTHFQNPWPSFKEYGLFDLVKTRFGSNRNFVPVPENRQGLVKIQEPDWGGRSDPNKERLKATWIGHASWLVETAAQQHAVHQESEKQSGSETGHDEQARRGVRVLLDPVFSERTSPFSFFGPKRYTPTPCSVADLPEVDLVCISHNHYDHLDSSTVQELSLKSSRTHFLCPLGIKAWFVSIGVDAKRVTELDWWQAVESTVSSVGTIRVVCTPAQHTSARGVGDKNKTLWCSWALGSLVPSTPQEQLDAQAEKHDVHVTPVELPAQQNETELSNFLSTPRLYFAGDTGYRTVSTPNPTVEEAAKFPHCPAFSTIGSLLGPFDLALLPIGLYSPRDFMSSVHCCPEDSACLAKDVKAKRSIGMHYGTVRGGLSGQYEDVLEPPRRWKKACEDAGLRWGEQAGLCDIGETVVV